MLLSTSLRTLLWIFILFAQRLSAQVDSVAPASTRPNNLLFSIPLQSAKPTALVTISGARNATFTSRASSPRPSTDVTAIVGLPASSKIASKASTASVSAVPTNTRPCNGYVEFCSRRFSNISMVVAHNSPFVRPHNAASNQVYPVLDQLNNGIRGFKVQFETHKPNASSAIRLCHTSCDLLDVGTLQAYLTTVRGWLESHPYEVITIMMGNNNGQSTRIPASDYVMPFQEAGLTRYLWTPPAPTLNLTEWPTLSEMILKNERVVVMLDYGTNQTEVPWLLNEFDYQWETPFSPTDPAFPCTQQRPPNQTEEVSRNRMYMLNHNLNIQVSLLGQSILIPAYSLLDEVNAVSGNGSLGLNAQHCEQMWNRPPNWLLVDYYNFGNFNGSVFEVAAAANNVTYKRGSCCGSEIASKATRHAYDLFVLLLFFVCLCSSM